MKNNLLQYYIAAFYLCSTVVMFAQGTTDGTGTLEDNGASDTTPAAPIDDYVWVLAMVGLVFVFMKFRAIKKRNINS